MKESVVRNLTKSIVAMAILAPASAYSLGIGDIKLHSTLNQNLNAEIALLVSADENISEVNVRLASPDKFDEAGVPWTYFLSKIKFKLITTENGSSVIKLTSSEALREPFLDFLLEVSWAKGNLYREFTVLVDPPAAYTQPIIPVINIASPAFKQTEDKVDIEVIETFRGNVDPIIQYGPIRTADSLWKIAKQTNTYSDVSIEQMMIAIYEANPKAFYKENVNALMADKTLTIPTREVILRLSKKEALSEFRRQNNIWNGRVTAKVKNNQTNSEKQTISTQLELEAPVEEEIKEAAIITESEPVINNTDEEFVVNSSDESMALLARLEKLEKSLLMMQKMLTLKDEQLAVLQNQENIKITAPLIDNTEKVKVEAADKSVSSGKKPQVSEAKIKVVEEKVVKPKPKLIEEAESGFFSNLLTPILSIVAVIILGLLGLLWSRKRQFEKEIDTDTESMFATASEISLPETTDDSLVSMMDDSSSYDVGTIGESSFLSEFTPSDFDAFETDQNEVDPVSEADVYLAYGRYEQAEDIMRQALIDQPEKDECKLKLLEIFYANENKSAFEEFAAELVSTGKHNDQEFWEKVIEMGAEIAPESSLFIAQSVGLNATGDAENTGSLANDGDLTEQLTDNNVSEEPSGDALDFDLSMFNDSGESEEKEDDNGLDFDLSIFDENEESLEKEDVKDLDFDLSVFDESDAETEEKENVSEFEVSDDDLTQDANDLGSVNIDTEADTLNDSVEDEIQQLEAGIETLDSLDFESADEEIVESSSDTGNDVDEVVESFDFSLDSDSSETTELEASKVATELDDIEGFDFDTESETSSSPADALDALDMGVSDLTDMDELETKIDLAKAYIDMGDVDAAMGIVDEVMEKGNEEQKATAQAILDQLK